MKDLGIYLHTTFACKYRKKTFFEEEKKRCIMQLLKAVSKKIGLEIVGLAVDDDHVHILYKFDPKTQVAAVICRLKSITSKRFNVIYGRIGIKLWQKSYSVQSVSLHNTTNLKKYLKHHKFSEV